MFRRSLAIAFVFASDGDTVNVPEFGNTEPGPKWTIEGYGVDPDIEVDNDLASVL